jgi:hypothetical protein
MTHGAEDEPLFAERAAGIDIAKAGIEVTVRVPSQTRRGGRQQETRRIVAATKADTAPAISQDKSPAPPSRH